MIAQTVKEPLVPHQVLCSSSSVLDAIRLLPISCGKIISIVFAYSSCSLFSFCQPIDVMFIIYPVTPV